MSNPLNINLNLGGLGSLGGSSSDLGSDLFAPPVSPRLRLRQLIDTDSYTRGFLPQSSTSGLDRLAAAIYGGSGLRGNSDSDLADRLARNIIRRNRDSSNDGDYDSDRDSDIGSSRRSSRRDPESLDTAIRDSSVEKKSSPQTQERLDRLQDAIKNDDKSAISRNAALIGSDPDNGTRVRSAAFRLQRDVDAGASKETLSADLKRLENVSNKTAKGDRPQGASHGKDTSAQIDSLGKAMAEQNWGEVDRLSKLIRDDPANSQEVKDKAKEIPHSIYWKHDPAKISGEYRDLVNVLGFRQG